MKDLTAIVIKLENKRHIDTALIFAPLKIFQETEGLRPSHPGGPVPPLQYWVMFPTPPDRQGEGGAPELHGNTFSSLTREREMLQYQFMTY